MEKYLNILNSNRKSKSPEDIYMEKAISDEWTDES